MFVALWDGEQWGKVAPFMEIKEKGAGSFEGLFPAPKDLPWALPKFCHWVSS